MANTTLRIAILFFALCAKAYAKDPTVASVADSLESNVAMVNRLINKLLDNLLDQVCKAWMFNRVDLHHALEEKPCHNGIPHAELEPRYSLMSRAAPIFHSSWHHHQRFDTLRKNLCTCAVKGGEKAGGATNDAVAISEELQSPEDRRIAEWEAKSAYYVAPAATETHKHIVDVLIKERAPELSRSFFWPLYRLVLNFLLGYGSAKRLVDVAGRWPAEQAFAHASGQVDMKLDVTGLRHLPKRGAVILAANHPTGIADGLAVHDMVATVRNDSIVFVNGDAVRLNPLLTDKLIPVEWRADKRSMAKSRETLLASNEAFGEGRAVVLFPSGRLAYMGENNTLQEQPWMPSVAALAKRYNCPIVPVHITARNSRLYYWLRRFNLVELRDMTLFYELFNKKGQTFQLQLQKQIYPEQLLSDNDEAAAELRLYVSEGVQSGLTLDEWRVHKSHDPSALPPSR